MDIGMPFAPHESSPRPGRLRPLLNVLGIVGMAAALVVPSTAPAADAPRRPNIVIILGDDLGYADMGSFGSEIATPNLDSLAKDGVRFTNFYTHATCSPTRSVLLSGVGLATAHSRMEGLRRQCATQIVVQDGQELGFTVSMGVASFPHTARSQDDLLAACDAALAEAQRRGGNVVTLASIRFET